MTHLGEEPIIEIFKDNLLESEAFEWEKFLIAFWGRRDIKTGCLCNHTDGGEGLSGFKHSKETCQKIQRSNSEQLRKLSEARRGKKLSTEHRANISKSHKGSVFSPEHCKNIGKTHQKPIMAMDRITGEDLMGFDSTKEASYFFGVQPPAINKALLGRTKTSAGCKWRYA